ncbi:MAG: ornithine carbamoyltransferase [Thermoplasmata archaeon]|nr:ornithine carbamoyltransferase [Thermoplasmata archaeon]MCI4359954.1 ornithine carbamoyltransferase [Thermoplasmata archaeon]
MTTGPTKRDLLSINDVAGDLPGLLDRALAMKRARAVGDRSRTRPEVELALIFEKPSTRTRTSFEVAVSDLGGRAIYYSSKDMQLGRGETVADTARVLSRYVDAIAYRAFRHSDEVELASHATVPVVNALDDHEHPCQIVADLLTLKERWPAGFRGRRLAYIGDGNNVFQSLLLGCAAVGLDLSAAIPKAYRPTREVVEQGARLSAVSGSTTTFSERPMEAARGADALYTDVWVSMGEESEKEERELAFQGFQINADLVRAAKPSAWVLHDLPAHRGLEITDEVIDGPQSAVWDQAENRLHAQKAILELVIPPRPARRPS